MINNLSPNQELNEYIIDYKGKTTNEIEQISSNGNLINRFNLIKPDINKNIPNENNPIINEPIIPSIQKNNIYIDENLITGINYRKNSDEM